MSKHAIELLEEVAATLRKEVAANISGEARYHALLSANSVATAAREWRMEDKLAQETEIDIHAIRSGAHDNDTKLYEELRRRTALRAWISDPANLDAQEQAQYVDGIKP